MFDLRTAVGTSAIKPGERVEDCKLVGVERDKESGAFIIKFKKGGAVLDHREFVPEKMATQTDEQFKNMVTMGTARIAHIARGYSATEDEYLNIQKGVEYEQIDSVNFAKKNWMKFTSAVAKFLLGKVKAGCVDCALKVILRENKKNGKYYSALPAVTPFISTEWFPQDFSTDPKWDLYERPGVTPDAEGVGEANPEADFTESTEATTTEAEDDFGGFDDDFNV